MTGSHLVFGKTTPLQCRGDRLVEQIGIRDSEQEATGPGRVNGAWAEVLSLGMESSGWLHIVLGESRPESQTKFKFRLSVLLVM